MLAVILVNYNNSDDTIDCVNSLKNSTYNNFIVIVVDNGSNSKDKEYLSREAEKSNFVLISSDKNLGFSGGNNLGIKYALEHNADFLLLLNNDTVVKEDFLKNIVASYSALSQNGKEKVIVSPKINYFYDKNKIWYCGGTWNPFLGRITHIGINEQDSARFSKNKEVSFETGCCMLIPAEAIKQVGLMDEEYFLYCEDTDYCLRLRKTGYHLWVVPSAVIYHKVSASTKKDQSHSPSAIYTYYAVRNKQYLIDRYVSDPLKPIARFYSRLEISWKIKKREYDPTVVEKALADYKAGILGNSFTR